jgi:hypothetical protein
MSRAVLKGNASGTGTVTLSSPDTNDNYTLELPTDAGTVLNTASDIEAQVKTATSATGSAPIYACRAWVNFDGTTTPPTIRASGNVSSVTKNGAGDYTVNFTTALPDVNYCSVGGPIGSLSSRFCFLTGSDDAPTTTSLRFLSLQTNSPSNPQEPNQLNIAIFR